VKPIAEALDRALADHNIRAVACPGGQARGQDNDVRVFDVQHIKGLEFEAVFFGGVDLLGTREPNLFEKYLYVGATRAATYLGLTTAASTLPEESLHCHTHSWTIGGVKNWPGSGSGRGRRVQRQSRMAAAWAFHSL
jgi:hypothetical protein